MNIEKLLRDYRKNQGKLKILRDDAEKIEEELRLIIHDSVKYMSNSALSHVPFSVTNKFKSLTEDAGIKSANCTEELRTLLEKVRKDISDTERIVLFTETVLNILGDEERFIVENLYVNNYQKYYIPNLYRDKFQQPISMKTIWNKKAIAFEKIGEFLQEVA